MRVYSAKEVPPKDPKNPKETGNGGKQDGKR